MRESIKMKTDNLNFKFRVSGIVIKENKVLFVDMDNSGFLCLPGGYVELGETTEKACLRELNEEVGGKFKVEKYCGVIENFFKNKFNKYMHEISFYYMLTAIDDLDTKDFIIMENDKGNTVKLDFKWIEIDKIDDYDIRPSFLKTVFDQNYVPKTIKKYSPERLCDLENVIEGYIVTLRKELDCYVYLKKYIEIYLLKLEEYLNNLKSLTLNVPSSEDITSIDDILNYTKFLDQKSLRDILNGKINTFETMIMLMKQELVSVHQAIINHFITINSLTLSRSAILPLLTTEIAISVGNKTEKSAIELSNDLIGLLQSVVNKNYEDALANLEKLKTSSLSDDVILKLNEEVKRYLVATSASQKLLESTDTTKDKSNRI